MLVVKIIEREEVIGFEVCCFGIKYISMFMDLGISYVMFVGVEWGFV